MVLGKALVRDLRLPLHWMRAVLASFRFGFPAKKLHIVMVTGTDGKTTTSTWIYQLLKNSGKKVALISTVAAFIGDDVIDTGFHVTSPDATSLQALLRKIVQKGFEYVVIETTSHGIHQHRVWGITPEVAVLTNITHEHLDYHLYFKHYLQTKLRIFRHAKYALVHENGTETSAVLDELRNHNVSPTLYSVKRLPDDVRAVVINTIPQTYNQQNAAAALFAAQCLGVTQEVMIKTMHHPPQIVGRLQKVENKSGIEVIVDFAHTPRAVESVLDSLQGVRKNGHRLIAVLGSAGKRDVTKRPLMGKSAVDRADLVVFTAEDPRGEPVFSIIRQMKEQITSGHAKIHSIDDRAKAITFALSVLAKKGDTVVLLGKGHEKSMNIDGVHEEEWSDYEYAQSVLLTMEKK